MRQHARRLTIGIVGLVIALSVAALWHRRSPDGVLEICEQFAMLAVTSRCREAYKFSIESTYSFSSVDTFCKEHEDDYAHAAVACRPGKWDGQDYIVEGVLERSRPAVTYPNISFGMVLRQVSGKWYVARWTLEE